jgi:hypothetical protein
MVDKKKIVRKKRERKELKWMRAWGPVDLT